MRVLSIETSTMFGGVAVVDSGAGLLAEERCSVKTGHAERLMGLVDRALGGCGLGLEDLDAIAVAVGPGSFTGLRIGLGTAKGLAFSTGLGVVAVPTLEAFALCLPCLPHPLCPMLDARRGEVYAGVFLSEGEDVRRLVPETSIKAVELAARFPGCYDRVLFIGDGADIYREDIKGVLGGKAVFLPPHLAHLNVPSPASVASLGLKKALRGEFAEPADLSPFYVRKSEAELKGP
jgi:tRNA threonylcarbamoyladenosine biosynthesis protein TsaB